MRSLISYLLLTFLLYVNMVCGIDINEINNQDCDTYVNTGTETVISFSELESEITALRQEVSALRGEMKHLRESIELLSGNIREQAANMNSMAGYRQPAQTEKTLRIPPPHSISQQEAREVFETREELPITLPETLNLLSQPESFKEMTYTVLGQWGRTPEEARSLGPNVSSLRGMVGVVETGGTDADLLALARKIRKELSGYDNINIDNNPSLLFQPGLHIQKQTPAVSVFIFRVRIRKQRPDIPQPSRP